MPIHVHETGTMITGADGMGLYRMLALRMALSLEIKGLRSRRVNAYTTIKREYNLKGS